MVCVSCLQERIIGEGKRDTRGGRGDKRTGLPRKSSNFIYARAEWGKNADCETLSAAASLLPWCVCLCLSFCGLTSLITFLVIFKALWLSREVIWVTQSAAEINNGSRLIFISLKYFFTVLVNRRDDKSKSKSAIIVKISWYNNWGMDFSFLIVPNL